MQVIWLVVGIGIIYRLPKPIFVVQIASVMALAFSPVLYWLTIKAIKDNFKTDFERELLPSKFLMAMAWIGTVSILFLTIYVLYMKFG